MGAVVSYVTVHTCAFAFAQCEGSLRNNDKYLGRKIEQKIKKLDYTVLRAVQARRPIKLCVSVPKSCHQCRASSRVRTAHAKKA